MNRLWIAAAGLGGFASVVLGAAGRHLASDAAPLDIAARYVMYHSLALLIVGLLERDGPGRDKAGTALRLAGWCFLGGMIAFAGGLIALAATGSAAAGATTPIGGGLFMVGWLALALHGWHRVPRSTQQE
jgi:uncharacterized membrane protein YgdD (TMEM256/DUF423 family)